MTSKRQALLASRQLIDPLDGANAISRNDLIPMDQPMDKEQLEQRARLIRTILDTRRRVQSMRERTEALNEALEAFRDRQEEIRRRA
jgi:hypothetical protein